MHFLWFIEKKKIFAFKSLFDLHGKSFHIQHDTHFACINSTSPCNCTAFYLSAKMNLIWKPDQNDENKLKMFAGRMCWIVGNGRFCSNNNICISAKREPMTKRTTNSAMGWFCFVFFWRRRELSRNGAYVNRLGEWKFFKQSHSPNPEKFMRNSMNIVDCDNCYVRSNQMDSSGSGDRPLDEDKLRVWAFFRLANCQTKPFAATRGRRQCTPTSIPTGQTLSTASEFWLIIVSDGGIVGNFILGGVFLLQSFQVTTDDNAIACESNWRG